MKSVIYIEGGGESKDLHSACREGFRRLIEKSGFTGSMPRLVASGSRERAFKDFRIAIKTTSSAGFIGLWIDSETPMDDIERTWDHLRERDKWHRPEATQNDQVLMMTTCMETWLIADPSALKNYFRNMREADLLPSANLENYTPQEILKCLRQATREDPRPYAKGKQSFVILGRLDPQVLMALPSFNRCIRILKENL